MRRLKKIKWRSKLYSTASSAIVWSMRTFVVWLSAAVVKMLFPQLLACMVGLKILSEN